MITITIPERNNKALYFPENLAECDASQYEDMAKLLYMLRNKELTYIEFRILAVYALLGMKFPKKQSIIPSEENQKSENIYRLSELVDTFFERKETEEGLIIEPKYGFIHNHYPVHRIFTKYYGPTDGFQNVSFGQYIDGLEEYIYFSQHGDLDALRLLFAIFYLPKGEKYDLELCRKRAKGILKHTDIRHLYGFYLFFTSMQHYILGGQLSVMGNEIDLSIIYQELPEAKSAKSEMPGIGMHSVLHDLAESGVFGNFREVRETNMWSILLRLYDMKKKAIDEIRQEAQNNQKI